MKLDVQFPELDNLIARMGGKQSSWRLPSPECGELIAGDAKGVPLDLETLEGLVVKTGCGRRLLSSGGNQVVLYIKDTRLDRDILLNDVENAVRFHISDCVTIQRLRREKRFERYVWTTRSDGKFMVESSDYEGDVEVSLGVCRYCLKELDWRGWISQAQTGDIWHNFSLQEFFDEFETFFSSLPQYSSATTPRGGYAANWNQIATEIKQQRNWCCEECGVDLSHHKPLLHAHHRNGVVSDNHPSNIDVLCKMCHSEKPSHGRLRASITRDERSLIARLRQQQTPLCEDS